MTILEDAVSPIQTAWNRLSGVNELSFESQSYSKTETGWRGTGRAKVTVEKPEVHVLIFQEQGVWTQNEHAERHFTNVFRWTLNSACGLLET